MIHVNVLTPMGHQCVPRPDLPPRHLSDSPGPRRGKDEDFGDGYAATHINTMISLTGNNALIANIKKFAVLYI